MALPYPHECLIAFFSFLLLATPCHAARPTRRQSNDTVWTQFHHRQYYQSVVVNDNGVSRLYLDGGEIFTWNGEGDGYMPNVVNETLPSNFSTGRDDKTHMIPLDKSWMLGDLNATNTQKPEEFPGLIFGTLWTSAEGGQFYSLNGGLHDNYKAGVYSTVWRNLHMWEFTPYSDGTGEWNEIAPSPQSNVTELTPTSGSFSTSYNGLGFAVGGWRYGDMLPGLIMYNDSTQQWWNLSTTAYSADGSLGDGAAHFVPDFGPGGLLFIFGGSVTESQTLVSYEDVYMFEPFSQQWRSRAVSGDLPNPAAQPCVTGVKGDDGTYEIFLYGGYSTSLENTIAQGAVWSLTLPAFHWQRHNTNPEYGRSRHSCAVGGNRQMIVVGGASYTMESTLEYLVPDPWPQGIGVYDLSVLQWKDGYDADAEAYVTPDVIKQYYQANGSEPSEWTDDNVREWFQSAQRVRHGGTSGGADESRSDKNGGDSNGTSVGAIVGGVVGGVAVLALLGATVWFVLRRHRKQRRGHQGTVYAPAPAREEGEVSQYRPKETTTVGEMDGRASMSELPVTGRGRRTVHELPGREEPVVYE